MNERPTDHPSVKSFSKTVVPAPVDAMSRPRVINERSESRRAQDCADGLLKHVVADESEARDWKEEGSHCCAVNTYCLGIVTAKYAPNSNRITTTLSTMAFSLWHIYEYLSDHVDPSRSRSHDSSNSSVIVEPAISRQSFKSSNVPLEIHGTSCLTSSLPSLPSPSHTSSA